MTATQDYQRGEITAGELLNGGFWKCGFVERAFAAHDVDLGSCAGWRATQRNPAFSQANPH